MTATCRRCRGEIAQRFVGTVVVWGHLVNPRDEHHYAVPVRDAFRAEAIEHRAPPSGGPGLSPERSTG